MVANKTDLGNVPIIKNKPEICLVAATYYKKITENLILGCSEILKKVNAKVNIRFIFVRRNL